MRHGLPCWLAPRPWGRKAEGRVGASRTPNQTTSTRGCAEPTSLPFFPWPQQRQQHRGPFGEASGRSVVRYTRPSERPQAPRAAPARANTSLAVYAAIVNRVKIGGHRWMPPWLRPVQRSAALWSPARPPASARPSPNGWRKRVRPGAGRPPPRSVGTPGPAPARGAGRCGAGSGGGPHAGEWATPSSIRTPRLRPAARVKPGVSGGGRRHRLAGRAALGRRALLTRPGRSRLVEQYRASERQLLAGALTGRLEERYHIGPPATPA
jgi:hypothetical protein